MVDQAGKDLAPRNGSGWSVAAVVAQMRSGLAAAKADVPAWFELFAAESEAHRRGVEVAVFGMT